MANAPHFVEGKLKQFEVVLFGKSYSPETKLVLDYLWGCPYFRENNFNVVNIESRTDCSQVEDYLWKLSGQNNREVPLLFVAKRFFGGYTEISRLHQSKKLFKAIKNKADEANDHPSIYMKMDLRIEELDDTEVVIRVSDDMTHHVGANTPDADFDTQFHAPFRESFLAELKQLSWKEAASVPVRRDSAVKSGVKLNYFKHRMSEMSTSSLSTMTSDSRSQQSYGTAKKKKVKAARGEDATTVV